MTTCELGPGLYHPCVGSPGEPVQDTHEASWIPAPDQVEGRLFAGMTATTASEKPPLLS